MGIGHCLFCTFIAVAARGQASDTDIIRPEAPVGEPKAPVGEPEAPAGPASVPDLANPLAPASALPVETPAIAPPPTVETETLARIDVVAPSGPRRPRFEVAIGMGVSRDRSGLVGGRTVAIPAFQVEVGVGDGLLGFEGRLFSNQAAGRYHEKSVPTTPGSVVLSDMAVDRQAIDVLLAFRPFASTGSRTTLWLNRVGRAVTFNLGVALETASVGPPSVTRVGPVLGLHFDLPLTSGRDAGDLRIRVGARRMFAGQGRAGTVTVSDTQLEAFGGLALVF